MRVRVDGEMQQLLLIGTVDNYSLPFNVARFARRVQAFKGQIVPRTPSKKRSRGNGKGISKRGDRDPRFGWASEFVDEFSGKKSHKTKSRTVVANCSHGKVAKQLKAICNDNALNVGNRGGRDLYVLGVGANPEWLFEIKTKTDTSSLFAAIGQLLTYSVLCNPRPQLVAIFPKGITENKKAVLAALQIRCVTFTNDEKRGVVFDGLPLAITGNG